MTANMAVAGRSREAAAGGLGLRIELHQARPASESRGKGRGLRGRGATLGCHRLNHETNMYLDQGGGEYSDAFQLSTFIFIVSEHIFLSFQSTHDFVRNQSIYHY